MVRTGTRVLLLFMYLFWIGLIPSTTYGDDPKLELVLVTSQKNPQTALTSKELKDIYLGNSVFWRNGHKAYPVMVTNEKTETLFLETYLDLSRDQFNTHWRRRLFSGKAIPPRRVTSEKQLAEFFDQENHSLSYVPKAILPNYPQFKVLVLEK